ncbi:MAG: hypothetical protein ACLR76_06525, partial [Alistipes sp.]
YRCRTAIEGAGYLLCRSAETGRRGFLMFMGTACGFRSNRISPYPSVPLVFQFRFRGGDLHFPRDLLPVPVRADRSTLSTSSGSRFAAFLFLDGMSYL